MNVWRKIFVVLGFTSIIAVPAGLIWGGRVLERSPIFCGSCHEMKPSYDGWMASGAAKEHPTCIECHSGDGLSGILESEIRGMRMIGMHFFGKEESGHPIRVKMPEAFCLKCHSGEKLVASHSMFRTEGQTCADCHKHGAGWKFKGQMQQ
jgi:nitrate/TMAO reductase-like tetraheme cytochrome c subunit